MENLFKKRQAEIGVASMLTWLTLKKFLNKSWIWLKHNWHAPAIVIYTIILWVFFRKKDKAREVLQERVDSYKLQIDAINKSHNDELAKRDAILKQYTEILTELEEEFQKKNKELDDKKKKKVKELVEEYHDRPDELAKEIADKFGFIFLED